MNTVSSAPVDQRLVNAEILIRQRQFVEARSLLSSIQSQDHSQLRHREHLFGMSFLHEGEMLEAKKILKITQIAYGNHLRLLADIANCLYFLGEMSQWRQATMELEQELQKTGELASLDTLQSAQICLAKFKEELGQLDEAFDIYNVLWARDAGAFRTSLLAQRIRVRSMSRNKRGLGAIYQQLVEVAQKDHSLNNNIEVLHSLMLAESILIGPQLAALRLHQALEIPQLNSFDRKLFLFDYLESLILAGHAPVAELLSSLSQSSGSFDVYEQMMFDLFSGQAIELEHLNSKSSQLSPAGYLRCLGLSLRLTTEGPLRDELRNRFVLLIDGLSPASQSYWKSYLLDPTANDRIEILLFEKLFVLEYSNQKISFQKKKNSVLLLKALSESSIPLGIEQVVHVLWGETYGLSHYDRVRMIVSRLNKNLLGLCGRERCIEFENHKLSLFPGIRIRVL